MLHAAHRNRGSINRWKSLTVPTALLVVSVSFLRIQNRGTNFLSVENPFNKNFEVQSLAQWSHFASFLSFVRCTLDQ